MFGQVCVQNGINDKLARLMLQLIRHILHYIARVIWEEKHGKSSGEMVIFKDIDVGVSDGQRMFGPDHELVVEPWMFVVMDETSDERSENVMLFQSLFDFAI